MHEIAFSTIDQVLLLAVVRKFICGVCMTVTAVQRCSQIHVHHLGILLSVYTLTTMSVVHGRNSLLFVYLTRLECCRYVTKNISVPVNII